MRKQTEMTGTVVRNEEGLSQPDLNERIRKLGLNRRVSPRQFRFRSAPDVRRDESIRRKRRARRSSLSLFLQGLRQRKRERGYFGRPSRGLWIQNEMYDRFQRRSMIVLFLVPEDGKGLWLLIEKTDQRSGRMFLTWPGGKAESAGEHPLQTAVRELKEETALDLSSRTRLLKGCGALVLPDEGGEIDIFFAPVRLSRRDLSRLRSKPHHGLILLSQQRLAEELGRPSRFSQNALGALRLVGQAAKK